MSTPENALIAAIYAAALERENIAVERHMDLGGDRSTLAALQRGEIDVYPGYVRFGTTISRNFAANDNDTDLNEALKPRYEERFGVTWLPPAPLNVSQCLAVSQVSAQRHWLLNLSKCAQVASELRLAASPDFLAPGGVLERFRRVYGGFRFKSVIACDPGSQYYAVARGDADVANAFTTDPKIAEDQLIVLEDDKHVLPRRSIAPVMRLVTLAQDQRVKLILIRASRRLSQFALQQLNMRADLLHAEPRDLAEDFFSRR